MQQNATPSSLAQLGRGLDQLLGGHLRRIRRRFLAHGLGWVVAAVAVIAALYYASDRSLSLPVGVRVLASLGFLAYLVAGVRRRVLYPMTRQFAREDVAIALERRFPELREQLISAVQLKDSLAEADTDDDPRLRNQSAAMIARVISDAANRIQTVPHQQILNPRRTLRVWSIAAAASLLVLVTALGNPQAFGVFLRRVWGSDASYPRLTTLRVELPESSQDYRIEREGRQAKVTMPAGADLPVLVSVEGVVPREVMLRVRGGRGMAPQAPMTVRGPRRFRHVFRRVSSGFSFHAAGGDDLRGDLDVEVHTIRPPRVGTIRTTLAYPAYTRRDPRTQAGGSFEALVGTSAKVELTTTSPVQEAALTFLESGRQVALTQQKVTDDEGTKTVLIGEFVVEQSDRYQVLLVSPDGLKNPHPGTYPVVAVVDQAPVGRILSPPDDNLSVVLPSGVVPFRLSLRDDYGLAEAHAAVRIAKLDKPIEVSLLESPAEGAAPPRETVVTRLFEAGKLADGHATSVGDSIGFAAVLTDNRQPEPNVTEIPTRPVHVVGEADLARRISGHFRRIRESIDGLRDVQKGLIDRLTDVRDGLARGETRNSLRGETTIVQVGQARVQSSVHRVHVELMRAFDLHLFNRLEASPHAATVMRLYVDYYSHHPEAEEFLPDFYTMLDTERREGRLGSMPKTLDPILDMTLACWRVADKLAPATNDLLERAAVAATNDDTAAAIGEALDRQKEIQTTFDQLAEMLAKWNEFQDVIIQTRSVLEKEREIEVRTRDILEGGPVKEGRKR